MYRRVGRKIQVAEVGFDLFENFPFIASQRLSNVRMNSQRRLPDVI